MTIKDLIEILDEVPQSDRHLPVKAVPVAPDGKAGRPRDIMDVYFESVQSLTLEITQ